MVFVNALICVWNFLVRQVFHLLSFLWFSSSFQPNSKQKCWVFSLSLRCVWSGTYIVSVLIPTLTPTTTPPLVLPSNGKNKGAPTKILNPTPMEGLIWCKEDWIAPSLFFDDWRCEVEWTLLMLCLWRLATGLTCPLMMSSHLWCLSVLDFGLFWCSIHYWVHWTSFLSFRSFPIEFPSFDPSFPKTRTLSP